ncbi:MAG: TetR/AcrR family transcriptional regulator [Blautia sp.]
MRAANERLAADLMAAGKKEFLNHGFMGASLRNIAASLGVTTGAIYRYYTDKEALFDAIVAEPAQRLRLSIGRNSAILPIDRYKASCRNYQSCPTRNLPG